MSDGPRPGSLTVISIIQCVMAQKNYKYIMQRIYHVRLPERMKNLLVHNLNS